MRGSQTFCRSGAWTDRQDRRQESMLGGSPQEMRQRRLGIGAAVKDAQELNGAHALTTDPEIPGRRASADIAGRPGKTEAARIAAGDVNKRTFTSASPLGRMRDNKRLPVVQSAPLE